MNEKILKKIKIQSVKSLMDIILLAITNDGPITGYDAIGYIHEKYGVMMSAGTVYSHLYSLERHGLVTGNSNEKARIFTLTENGKKILNTAKENVSETFNVFINA